MDMPIPLPSNDVLGWSAALLTLMTFVCRDMRRLRLRLLALAANATFIADGARAHLLPVLVLQLALVPVRLAAGPARRAYDGPTRQQGAPR